MLRKVVFVSLALLTGCAAMDQLPPSVKNQLVKPPPYYGLNKDSYGPLTKYQDQEKRIYLNPPSCDSLASKDPVQAELARQITSVIVKPLDSIGKVDDTVRQEELQNYFLIKSDPGGAVVALLDRSPKEIVVWYLGDLITLSEVTNAADAFCKRENKRAFYEGSSRKCEPISKLMPVPSINGYRPTQNTFVISSFQCRGGDSSSTSSMAYDRTLLRDIQSELKRLKSFTGVADGKMGPKTEAAIKSFQKSKGLPVDGTPSPSLLDALKAN